MESSPLLHCIRLTFLFIHLQGALAQSSHSGLQIAKNTNSPHSHSHILLILPRWTVELRGVFSAQEHLRFTHIPNGVILKELHKLANEYENEAWKANCRINILPIQRASVLPPRPQERQGSHIWFKSTATLQMTVRGWREKARCPFRPSFFSFFFFQGTEVT